MFFENREVNYDKYPKISVQGRAWQGYEAIVKEIKNQIHKDDFVIVLDYYHGVDEEELWNQFIQPLNADHIIPSEQAKIDEKELWPMIAHEVSDDRVFGSMSTRKLKEFFHNDKLEELRKEIESYHGLTIVYGIGSSLITQGDLLIYGDIDRWEIQLRYRAGMTNWGVDNSDEDILRKYKRGYFLEWRVFDRHKIETFKHADYILDLNVRKDPKMIDKESFDSMMSTFSKRPFRLIPYFDEGIWGGRWMEEVCGLTHKKYNYAWCFDGVPEENAIRADFDGIEVEFPAMDLVKTQPVSLLGKKVFSRFGAEFPIRFDFLDTMDGGNLSLQVHPLTEYIHDQFGMSYTQDESYYILDAQEGAHVYLGVKEGVTKETLIPALKRAETGDEIFDDSKYINSFPVKKHDHILIPGGTIHCSGSGTMVLEISATPYIFTFKLWDWGRVGLDGKPRPINVDRGAENIQFDRTTSWCQKNLVSPIEELEHREHLKVEKTGLHELEFIETKRYWFDEKTIFECEESVNMLNLIEGEEVKITSLHGEFEPYVVHYAETFIVPESVKEYAIEPYGKSEGKTVAVIKASVRV